MEHYYDDSLVTLGDGSVSVDTIHGVEKVAGSRSAVRDPRLSALVKGRPGASRPETTHNRLMRGMKWCSEHDGDGWMPLSEFSPDPRYRDGKHPICKECRARHQRKLYAMQQQEAGIEVRPYRRRA